MEQDLSKFTTRDSLTHLWNTLSLPYDSLEHLRLEGGEDIAAPSSFKIGHLAQSSIALSGLVAATIHATRSGQPLRSTTVDRQHAVVEFNSEKLYLLNGSRPAPADDSIGGLHKTLNGHVRVHDSFPNHRKAALELLGCSAEATRREVGEKLAARDALDLENTAATNGAVIYATRSRSDWDATPQAKAVRDFPITITKVADSEPSLPTLSSHDLKQCLAGIRVLEMSRVIAAPVAGKTLAVHGADVLWVTSPNLPALPELDIDVGRGKRTTQLDINQRDDRDKLLALLRDADVFLQSYRPGSLAEKGFDILSLLEGRDGKPLICANLSAWGTEGPWSGRRGFDSIVQTVSGMNISEAEHYGSGAPRPMPCQALDHGAGYFLASGIMTALYRQMTEGGSYRVDVSLAGVAKYLKSLGQYEGKGSFRCQEYADVTKIPVEFMESRDCAFGELRAIKHAVKIEGLDVHWEAMPKPLGSDEAVWV